MTPDAELLTRYLDHEMSSVEKDAFGSYLAERPDLRRELCAMQELGVLLRTWSSSVEARAEELLEPTLARVQRELGLTPPVAST